MYIIIQIIDRNIELLEFNGINVFFDELLAEDMLYEDFSIMYRRKTGEDLSKDEFYNLKNIYNDDFFIMEDGHEAWINDIQGKSYDIKIVELKTMNQNKIA